MRASADSQGYYRLSRPEVQSLVPDWATHILDVGCASGALGSELKARQPCHVTGIELVLEVARQAELVLDRVLQGDAVAKMAELPDASLDCIVFADVIEHMVDPQACLEQAYRLLVPSGLVVASIPNVGHWAVIRDLLQGCWDYQDAGILDRTHLRFFTRRSLFMLFMRAGFEINHLGRTRFKGFEVPFQIIEAMAAVDLNTSALEQDGESYQFLVTATPAEPPPKIGTAAKERWLISNMDRWEVSLDGILALVPEGADVCILLRVPPGQAQRYGREVGAWLEARGLDSESGPELLLLDNPVQSETTIFRTATAWLDTGATNERSWALALGLRILSLGDPPQRS